MNLHQRGAELVNQLKALVLEALLSHPDGGVGSKGVSQREIARRAGLHYLGTLELDHTCHEMLSLLDKEGQVESLAEAGQPDEEVRWRLSPN
jgi:hypothetical protein